MNYDIWSGFIDLATYRLAHSSTYAQAKTDITPFLKGDSTAVTAILSLLSTNLTANEVVTAQAQSARTFPYNRDNSVAAAAFYLAGIPFTP